MSATSCVRIAAFRFSGGGVPTLSDDVVIVGRQRRKNGHQQNCRYRWCWILIWVNGCVLRVGYSYGPDGHRRVKSVRGQPLECGRAVRSDEALYRLWSGSENHRGALAFQGPLENPGLDVVAVREKSGRQPGIHLTGTLQSPRLS